MGLLINSTDSTPKTAVKGAAIGAFSYGAIEASRKIKNVAKDVFATSIREQKKILKNSNPEAVRQAISRTENLDFKGIVDRANQYSGDAVRLGNVERATNNLIKNGRSAEVLKYKEAYQVLENGKPSKYIAGKKAAKTVFGKIGAKFESGTDKIYKFIKSGNKKEILKNNSDKIKGGLKKYALPLAIAAVLAGTGAAIAKKAVDHKQKAKTEE